MMKLYAFSAFAAFLAPTSSHAATPSFDCKAAKTPIEIAICGDDRLSGLDADLNAAFKAAYASSDTKEALLAGQRLWLSRLADCKTMSGGDAQQSFACLRGRYTRRVAFLKRPMNLKVENVCHTLADAITFANGYVDQSRSSSIIDDASNDTLGAISRARASRDQSLNLARQAEQLKKQDASVAPFYYIIGPKQ